MGREGAGVRREAWGARADGEGGKVIEWSEDLEGALERARKERKAVFFYFAKDP